MEPLALAHRYLCRHCFAALCCLLSALTVATAAASAASAAAAGSVSRTTTATPLPKVVVSRNRPRRDRCRQTSHHRQQKCDARPAP